MANRKNRPVIKVESISVNGLKRMFSEGKFATVNFTKKSDGTNRTLNGKVNVQAALKGGEASYDAESRGQLRVCDVNVYKDKQGNRIPRRTEYRAVTAQNVNWVTAKGVKYIVEKPNPVENFIQGISYDRSTATLTMSLSGVRYSYHNVAKAIHEGLVSSTHKGEYYNENIKPYYRFTRLG